MKRKGIIIGVVIAAALAGALTVVAVVSPDAEVMRILKGALSPAQLGALLEFRQAHQAEMQARLAERDNPAQLWRELALTEDQQDRLLDVLAMNVDEVSFEVLKAQASGAALRRAVFAGVPDSPDLKTASDQLGKDIGDAAVAAALALADARSILTPAQIALLEARKAEHDGRLQEELDRMPARVEELVGLWSTLALSPGQVDALSSIHDLMPGIMRDRHKKERREFRDALATILNARQQKLVDRFHAQARPDKHARRLEDRKLFEQELALGGAQKVLLVNLLIGRRESLENSAKLLVAAGLDLRDQVLAVPCDEAAIRQSADRLAEIIGSCSSLAAEMVADARKILSDRQFAVIAKAAAENDTAIAQHLGDISARVHKLIAFLDELALTPEQQKAVVDLIEKKIEERNAEFLKMHQSL